MILYVRHFDAKKKGQYIYHFDTVVFNRLTDRSGNRQSHTLLLGLATSRVMTAKSQTFCAVCGPTKQLIHIKLLLILFIYGHLC